VSRIHYSYEHLLHREPELYKKWHGRGIKLAAFLAIGIGKKKKVLQSIQVPAERAVKSGIRVSLGNKELAKKERLKMVCSNVLKAAEQEKAATRGERRRSFRKAAPHVADGKKPALHRAISELGGGWLLWLFLKDLPHHLKKGQVRKGSITISRLDKRGITKNIMVETNPKPRVLGLSAGFEKKKRGDEKHCIQERLTKAGS